MTLDVSVLRNNERIFIRRTDLGYGLIVAGEWSQEQTTIYDAGLRAAYSPKHFAQHQLEQLLLRLRAKEREIIGG